MLIMVTFDSVQLNCYSLVFDANFSERVKAYLWLSNKESDLKNKYPKHGCIKECMPTYHIPFQLQTVHCYTILNSHC